MPDVMILLGSISDLEKTRPCFETLAELKISFRAAACSAHRTPDRVIKIIEEAERGGAQVFICVAGLAAHLAGAVAARTTRPVIGVPVSSGPLAGMDALFSTSQMPGGFPVAAMALDKPGAKNAALLAAQILALSNSDLSDRLRKARKKMEDDVEKASQELERQIFG